MYLKKAYGHVLTGQIHGCVFIVKKSAGPGWSRWVHRSQGKTHCEVCLRLDGCLFFAGKTPPCPHHPNCHCILEPVDDNEVLARAQAYSDYRKFDSYLFNTDGIRTHHKENYLKNGDMPLRTPFGSKANLKDRPLKSISPGTIL